MIVLSLRVRRFIEIRKRQLRIQRTSCSPLTINSNDKQAYRCTGKRQESPVLRELPTSCMIMSQVVDVDFPGQCLHEGRFPLHIQTPSLTQLENTSSTSDVGNQKRGTAFYSKMHTGPSGIASVYSFVCCDGLVCYELFGKRIQCL